MNWKVIKQNRGQNWEEDHKQAHNDNKVPKISKSLWHSIAYVTCEALWCAAITANRRLKDGQRGAEYVCQKVPFSYESIKNVGPGSLTGFFFHYSCGAALLMVSARGKKFYGDT